MSLNINTPDEENKSCYDRRRSYFGYAGRVVLEIIYAANSSAGTGIKIALPFFAKVEMPVNLWINNKNVNQNKSG